MQRVDFHAHTIHSDGTLTPSELRDLMQDRGVGYFLWQITTLCEQIENSSDEFLIACTLSHESRSRHIISKKPSIFLPMVLIQRILTWLRFSWGRGLQGEKEQRRSSHSSILISKKNDFILFLSRPFSRLKSSDRLRVLISPSTLSKSDMWKIFEKHLTGGFDAMTFLSIRRIFTKLSIWCMVSEVY